VSQVVMGKPKQTHCLRGHELGEKARITPEGWQRCLECERLRQKSETRLRGHVRRMERLLRDGLSTTSGGFREWQAQVWRFFEDVEQGRQG